MLLDFKEAVEIPKPPSITTVSEDDLSIPPMRTLSAATKQVGNIAVESIEKPTHRQEVPNIKSIILTYSSVYVPT